MYLDSYAIAQRSTNVQNGTAFRLVLLQSARMKKKELTRQQVAAVPCPTCGSGVRRRCVLHSGGLRSGPHLERKFLAAEAIEKK